MKNQTAVLRGINTQGNEVKTVVEVEVYEVNETVDFSKILFNQDVTDNEEFDGSFDVDWF